MTAKKVTRDDFSEHFALLRSEPEKYLELADEFIKQNPDDAHGYFTRHWAWKRLGRLDLALADLDRSVRIEAHSATFRARALVHRAMNRYCEAIQDFDQSLAMDQQAWMDDFSALFRADCHARLGNLEAALADCEALRDDHWTPGVFGAPAGTKAEVTAEIRRMALAVRHGPRMDPS
jgi:tetratricopeptide (TPR) repeat protein